ncbi:MAG: sugar phosphate isomerase/epimerase, partial [Christensenellaceae bacterium]
MKNIIAVNTNCYHGFSLNEALEGIAAAGFHYVELTAVRGWTEHVMPDMSKEQLEAVKQKMKSLDIQAISLSGHCNLMEEERLEDFERNIELAS